MYFLNEEQYMESEYGKKKEKGDLTLYHADKELISTFSMPSLKAKVYSNIDVYKALWFDNRQNAENYLIAKILMKLPFSIKENDGTVKNHYLAEYMLFDPKTCTVYAFAGLEPQINDYLKNRLKSFYVYESYIPKSNLYEKEKKAGSYFIYDILFTPNRIYPVDVKDSRNYIKYISESQFKGLFYKLRKYYAE